MPQMPASKLKIENQSYDYYAPETLAFGGIAKAKTLGNLPLTAKIMLENLMRHLDKSFVDIEDIKRLANWSGEEALQLHLLPSSEFKFSTISESESQDALAQNIKLALTQNKIPEIVTVQNNTLMPEIVSKSEPETLAQTAICNACGVLTIQAYNQSAAPNKYSPIEFQLKKIIRITLSGKPSLDHLELAESVIKQVQALDITGAIIEFNGKGIAQLDLETRALISGLMIQNGAQQALFPIDEITVSHVSKAMSTKVKDYAQAIGLWHEQNRDATNSDLNVKMD